MIDLTRYLPYGIDIQNEDRYVNLMKSCSYNGQCSYDRIADSLSFEDVKPILRPLPQLIEEITHEGKTFVPIVELAKFKYPHINNFTTVSDTETQTYAAYNEGGNFFLQFSYSFNLLDFPLVSFCCSGMRHTGMDEYLFQKLYEWHFWTGDQTYFEKGLIIEKPIK